VLILLFFVIFRADALGISRATANRHWAYAKARLRCELKEKDEG
jgi:hypothetical protein